MDGKASPRILDEDSEPPGPASKDVNSSYRTVPLHDPFDFYLFTDEAIVDFVNKYDDMYEANENLEVGNVKISLDKEPEIRDWDGIAMPSYGTSEDSDSGPEAHEVDPHKRTVPLYDPFDFCLFNDEAIKHFISENDTSSSDTSNSMDGPKKRRPSKKIKKTGSRPRSLTKNGSKDDKDEDMDNEDEEGTDGQDENTDDQHERTFSYQKPPHDPFDCDLSNDEAIVSFIDRNDKEMDPDNNF